MRGRRDARLAALQLLDSAAQLVVRTRDRQVCWVSDPDYSGNAYHLFRHAVDSRPALDHVWLVGPGAPVDRITEDFRAWGGPARGSTLRVVRRRTVRGYARFLRSRRTFHTHGIYPTVRRAHRRHVVSLWHGAPIKVIGALNRTSPNPHPTFGTLHLAPSELYRYVIAAAFRAEVDDVLLTSFPRCDALVRPHRSSPSREALRVALGLAPDRPLVLWLPTYRDAVGAGAASSGSFVDDLRPEELEAVGQAADDAGCSIVIKLHPYDRLAAEPAPALPSNLVLVDDPTWRALQIDLYDALPLADGLLTDVSSVLVDLLPTPLPLGMIGFDPATYTRDVVFPVEALLRSTRVHDLRDAAAVRAFFAAVVGDAGERQPDDLSPWLSSVPPGDGCERVLRAVGL